MHELLETDLGFPIENLPGLRCVADQQVHFRGAFVPVVMLHEFFPVEIHSRERGVDKFPNSMRFVCRQNEIVSRGFLHDSPHSLDVLRRVAPVAFGIEIAKEKLLLQSQLNRCDRSSDFSGHKGLAASRTFVVEKDAIAGRKPVTLAVVHRRPIREHLGDAIWTARPERRRFRLRDLLHFPEHFAARGLVKLRANSRLPNRFQDSDRPDAGDIGRIFRDVEADANMALRAKMINLIRLQFVNQLHQIHRIGEIAVVQE